MSNKPTHNICIAEDYTASDGKEKSHFTNVGSAWLKEETGNISCETREGIALTGRFVLVKPKDE